MRARIVSLYLLDQRSAGSQKIRVQTPAISFKVRYRQRIRQFEWWGCHRSVFRIVLRKGGEHGREYGKVHHFRKSPVDDDAMFSANAGLLCRSAQMQGVS